jgi:NADP-dependent aldehyde dehydrogenase
MLVNVGQACLKPAIVLAVDGRGFAGLREALASRIAAMPARTMLTPGISKAYRHNLDRQARAGATRVSAGGAPLGEWEGQAILSEVDGEGLLADPILAEEVFGPAALLVRLRDIDQLFAVAREFRGQLCAAMHIDREDFAVAARLLPVLERRTGRIVVNAFAHPQEVSFAAIHGGPFPATSDSRFTSVGMSAIERFLRPVCYQGFPDELLPEPLKQANPLGLARVVDGDIVSGKA